MNTDLLNDPDMQKIVQEGRASGSGTSSGDLSQLCNFGAIQDSITIGDYTFVIKTLTAGEQEKCLGAIAHHNITSLVVAAALQNQALARAIVSINGVPLQDVPFNRDAVGDSAVLSRADSGDVISRKLAVVLSWQDGLRQQLFAFHQGLSERSDEVLSGVTNQDLKD